MIISKKLVISLCDFRVQKKLESKNSSGMSTIHKDVNESLPNQKNLSTYEQMIQRNREERMAFLQSINIKEAKISLSKAVYSKQRKPKPSKRKVQASGFVMRKSERLANISANSELDDSYLKALKAIAQKDAIVKKSKNFKSKYLQEFVLKNKAIPPEMSFRVVLEDLYESYVEDICIKDSKCNGKSITYDKSDLDKMTIVESNVKISPDKITSLAWYPSSEELIVAAGDTKGNVAIKKVNSGSDSYFMKIHFKAVTNMQFNPFNPVQLISSSNDAVLRCGDMVQHKFNEIYNISEKEYNVITYFDILSATTFLVAERFGCVALVDSRIKKSEKIYTCHGHVIKALNIHPVNRNFFVSADNKGHMHIWDLRNLQNIPVATNYLKRAIRAAYFSPVTGNSVLTTCADDNVSIFDTSDLTKFELKQRKKHKLSQTVFRATWLPNSDEYFAVGGKDHPCGIEVYNKNMFPYSVITHENLTSIPSYNVFHPKRLALASAVSCGELFIFK